MVRSMTERIGSPESPPDARDGTAARGQAKSERQSGPDAPDSLRPGDSDELKSDLPPAHHDRAVENDKPGKAERAATALKRGLAVGIIGITSYAPVHQTHHEL